MIKYAIYRTTCDEAPIGHVTEDGKFNPPNVPFMDKFDKCIVQRYLEEGLDLENCGDEFFSYEMVTAS